MKGKGGAEAAWARPAGGVLLPSCTQLAQHRLLEHWDRLQSLLHTFPGSLRFGWLEGRVLRMGDLILLVLGHLPVDCIIKAILVGRLSPDW